MIEKIDDRNALNRYEISFLDREELKKEFQTNPFAKVLLLVEQEEVIGYLYYSDIYERAEINQIEIEISHRNCGKGKKLMEAFLKMVDKDVTLEVREDNIPAVKLYESCGFQKKAIREGYYQGIDGILMERKKDSN